jgi:16S rRNA (cytidine1402-2'-O)-methyltransferase
VAQAASKTTEAKTSSFLICPAKACGVAPLAALDALMNFPLGRSAVEDSRVTGKLLHHLGLKKKMRRYNDHSGEAERESLVAAARGAVVALVSDAGTPLISDPGYKLVRSAREAGVPVYTIPGASAVTAALSICGLPTDRFLFAGFLPNKAKARVETLKELGQVKATLVFYEAGPRLAASLSAIAETYGDREVAVARELTKKFEEVVTGTASELAARYAAQEPKGEIVLIIGPPADDVAYDTGDVDTALREALDTMSAAKAAGVIAKRFGLERSDVYTRATQLKSQ